MKAPTHELISSIILANVLEQTKLTAVVSLRLPQNQINPKLCLQNGPKFVYKHNSKHIAIHNPLHTQIHQRENLSRTIYLAVNIFKFLTKHSRTHLYGKKKPQTFFHVHLQTQMLPRNNRSLASDQIYLLCFKGTQNKKNW